MKPFEYLEGVTYADIAFKAYGNSVEELFSNAALAVTDSMVDPATVKKETYVTFTVNEDTLEKALFALLEEIVLLKDSQQVFLTEFKVRIDKHDDTYAVVVGAHGDGIDPDTQALRNDVKAVTYHEFTLDLDKKPMEATVVLDV